MTVLRVSLVNEDRGYIFSEWEEELEDEMTMGELYRSAQSEYGRCMSKIYVDREEGTPKPVGWYFVKRDRYDDYYSNETYLRGAWVTVA